MNVREVKIYRLDAAGCHRAREHVMKSAYGRQTPPPDYELTCVEPGSPMGELLRRYWQPVCTSDELKDLPKKVKLLCEEFVVLRDKKGRFGALGLSPNQEVRRSPAPPR